MGLAQEAVENTMSNTSSSKSSPQSTMLLKVDKVTKRFGGLGAVDNVSFELRRGETVGLIGPNGAGKTTLFNIMTGFVRADSGRIIFQGKDITHESTASIVNNGIARTFQIVRPFLNIPVFDNVLIAALSPHARNASKNVSPSETVRDVLSKVGLLEKANLDASKLTHGEQKRLEMARAIATKPDLLLLDEPYGGLGSNEIGPVSVLINGLSESGITILLIEHRLKELMKNVKRVIAMDQGALIADGMPEQVVNESRVIEAYLGKGGTGLATGSK